MAKAARISVESYTTACGEERWKIQGRKPTGEQVRERFKTLEEAQGRRSELEVEALNQTVAVRLRSTRLMDAQLAAVDYLLTEYREPVVKLTVDDAAAKFFADKKGQNLRTDSLKELHSRVGFLQALHSGRFVHTLTADDVRPAFFAIPTTPPIQPTATFGFYLGFSTGASTARTTPSFSSRPT